jgi:prepilin-type N-terminal cleavage/methylation domain-containing protein
VRLMRDERGFTLPELLISITILGMIIGPLTAALVVYTRNADSTVARMSESHDVQIASAYFAQDIQSTGVRATASPYNPAASIFTTWSVSVACDGMRLINGTPVPTTPIVRLQWDDPVSPAVRVQVSYVVADDPGGERQFRRIECRSTAGNPLSLTSELVVAHNLDKNRTVLQAAQVVCAPNPVCNATPVPRSVALTLWVRHPSSATALSVTLTGERRQS